MNTERDERTPRDENEAQIENPMSGEQPEATQQRPSAEQAVQTAPSEPVRQPEPQGAPLPTASQRRAPLRPRTSPMIWGAIVLVICAYFGAQLIAPGLLDTTMFLVVSLLGLGLLLLATGIAVIVRNLRSSRR